MQRVSVAIITVILSVGCSVLRIPFSSQTNKIYEKTQEDYVEHFTYLTDDFLKFNKHQLVKLTKAENAYLATIYQKIYKSNEILLKNEFVPEIYIIDSKLPFYFSMPKARFFISKILLTKYLRSEELLTAIIGQESIRSHLNLYNKKFLIPTGHVTLDGLLSLTKLPIEVREELSKWTYSALLRANEDPKALLNLVQIQNKFQMDFLAQFDSVSDIIKVERMLKNYIASEGLKLKDSTPRTVSPMYYELIKRIQ
jgi:hypothetical protein